MDIETIRKAVTKNRGGLEGASDGQIMTIWESLDSQTQEQYLKKFRPAREGKVKDANRT